MYLENAIDKPHQYLTIIIKFARPLYYYTSRYTVLYWVAKTLQRTLQDVRC